MFKFVRSSSLTAQIMIPVIGFLFFASGWFLPARLAPGEVYGNGYYYLPTDGLFYNWWRLLAALPLWVQVVPTLLLAVVSALSLVHEDTRHLLLGRRCFGIAYVYLFLVASSGYLLLAHPAFLAGYLMLLGTGFVLDLFKNEAKYDLVFGFCFTWGLAALIYPPVVVVLPVIIIGLAVMVSTLWRHWVVALTGLILPALITVMVLYLTGDLQYEISSFLQWFRLRTTWPPDYLTREPFLLAWLGILLFWIVVASLSYRNPKIQSRQLFLVNFSQFLFLLVMALGLETVSVEVLWLLLVPVTYLLTLWALEVRRGWVRDLFFLSLLASFIFFRIRGLV